MKRAQVKTMAILVCLQKGSNALPDTVYDGVHQNSIRDATALKIQDWYV